MNFEFGQRQVDPPALQVFTHVADEVGQLEGHAEVTGVCVGTFGPRLQDGHHLQPDHRRRPVDVFVQIVVGPVLLDGQIHSHGVEERLEVLDRDGPAHRCVHRGGSHRVRTVPALQVGQEHLGPSIEGVSTLLRGESGVDPVHDLVGVPRQAVEGVNERAFVCRQ